MSQIPALSEALRETFKRGSRDDMPPRVVAAIRRRENSAEILVKLIQLSVVGVWAVLYFVSPKTDVGTPFSPVPYALAGYFVLNLIGLVWAMRRGLPNWSIYINIIIDISMLMTLIWSFHIQYGQPPSFYLKAPTILYIFIFIALRTLRFQARFVIATGIMAALGWLMMTAYVVFSDPANSMITRDYIEYMTSNAVLLGAEFDKIISILIVTVILALALRRAHGLLVQAVSEGTAAQDLSRFFDAGVADAIRSADHAVKSGEGIRRNAAIVFVDIRGFSDMSAKLEPRRVVSMLTAYEKRIVPIIQRNGGTIDKFLGDGIMASFGAVLASKTFAADALRAIDEIIEETETWPRMGDVRRIAPENVNMSVASGPVVFGALGGENRLEFTTIGSTVNLAAKLEKHNKTLNSRAVTDAQTWRRALAQGYPTRKDVTFVKDRLDALNSDLELVVLHAR